MRIALAVLLTASVALAKCPKGCSSHGRCTINDVCLCEDGFMGPDCSLRVCPQAESWAVDEANPHEQAECAGRGSCNRGTGECDCYPGYTGSACERTDCPNKCSGHGKCRMIQDLPNYDPNSDSSLTWEEKALTACVCDGGFTGPDCSLRVCPFGDDPLTVCDQSEVQEQVQQLRVWADLKLDANQPTGLADVMAFVGDEVALSFKTTDGTNQTTNRIEGIWGDGSFDNTATNPATFAYSSLSTDSNGVRRMEAGIESLPNFAIRDVTVTESAASAADTRVEKKWQVTFHHRGDGQNSYGKQNLLNCHMPLSCSAYGCQPRVRQSYLMAIQQNDGSAALAHVNQNKMHTSDLTLTASAGTWVKFTADSVLSCPTTASSCSVASNKKYKPFAGLFVYFKGSSKQIWVRGFGAGDSEALELHTGHATITGSSQTNKPTSTAVDTASKNYKYQGVVTSSNYNHFPIGEVIPNTYLEFPSGLPSRSTDLGALIFFEPAKCDVRDITKDSTFDAEVGFNNDDVENIECSGRGECDRSSGLCTCFEGYSGPNCGAQSSLA